MLSNLTSDNNFRQRRIDRQCTTVFGTGSREWMDHPEQPIFDRTKQADSTQQSCFYMGRPSGLDGRKRGKTRESNQKKNERMGGSILFFLRAPTHFVERLSGTAQLPLPSLPRGHASKRTRVCFHAHGTISSLITHA